MNFPLFIARRLKLTGNSDKESLSAGTLIAVAGVALAVLVMILAMAVVLGFKQQIREKVTGFDAQITVTPYSQPAECNDQAFITLDGKMTGLLREVLPEAEISLTLKQPGIIKTPDNFVGLVFKGFDSGHDWEFVKKNLTGGEVPDYSDTGNNNRIVVSSTTAKALGLGLGDRVNTYFFTAGNLRARKFEIAGIYDSKFGEYDKLYAFAPLGTLQRIAVADSLSGTAVEIRKLDQKRIESLSEQLQGNLTSALYRGELEEFHLVENVRQIGAIYFNWLDLLDTNVAVILILMACIAAVTLISSLFIIILDRVRSIGILKALGATNSQIRRIFVYAVQRLVLSGMVIGNVLALALEFVQYRFHLLPLNPESYYLSYVPVRIDWGYLLLLDAGILLLSVLVLVLPSHLAATVSPAQTMKYE